MTCTSPDLYLKATNLDDDGGLSSKPILEFEDELQIPCKKASGNDLEGEVEKKVVEML